MGGGSIVYDEKEKKKHFNIEYDIYMSSKIYEGSGYNGQVLILQSSCINSMFHNRTRSRYRAKPARFKIRSPWFLIIFELTCES
jgi:hypothetical protein